MDEFRHRFLFAGLLIIAVGVSPVCLGQPDGSFSQDATPMASPIEKQSAPGFQVIESWKVDKGDHAVYFNRVAAPDVSSLKAARRATPTPAPEAAPVSPEEMAADLRRQQKRWETLFLSVTVYDHQVSEVRWGPGNQYRVFSNIDFNYFSGMNEVESDDAFYTLVLGLGNEVTGDAMQAVRERRWSELAGSVVPGPAAFGNRGFRFLLDKGSVPPPAEALRAMEALHAFYRENSQKLAEAYAKREADQAERVAREGWEKEHPQKPRDRVINFWVKPGSGSGSRDGEVAR
jgi:hypothetical protein